MLANASKQELFAEAIFKLAKKDLDDPTVQASSANGSRGSHLVCIVGHQRQYTEVKQ
jgi:hypothetical protein